MPRTWFTTLLGAASILCGGIGSLFSAFALLLAIGKPYANSATGPLDIFLIFILPPGTLLAGIGLLFRKSWARWWLILLMSALVALGLKALLAPAPATEFTAPLPQVFPIIAIAISSLILLGLFSPPVRREFRTNAKTTTHTPPAPPPVPASTSPDLTGDGWRVGHHGRDQMFYEELHNGAWQRIEIDGEMLMGRAHHVIYFAGPQTWQSYPAWARGRREEIISRVKSRFREPDYEYTDGGTVPRPSAHQQLSKNDGSILPFFLFLIVVATVFFWFAATGVKNGYTRSPGKHAPASHRITKAEKPVLFWTSITIFAGLGTGCTVLAGWLVIQQRKK